VQIGSGGPIVPKTTYEKSVCRAVSIDERFLKSLYALVNDAKSSASFTVHLSDGAKIEQLSIEELIALPNSAARAFTRLDLHNFRSAEPHLYISIDGTRMDSTVTYSVKGSDKEASYIHGEIDRLLKDCYVPFSYFFSLPASHADVWWLLLTTIARSIMPRVVFEIGDGVERRRFSRETD
jgi:hypothetical protein